MVAWGDNKHGQLALDPQTTQTVFEPRIVPQQCFRSEKITDILSGWTHLLAVTGEYMYIYVGRTLMTV